MPASEMHTRLEDMAERAVPTFRHAQRPQAASPASSREQSFELDSLDPISDHTLKHASAAIELASAADGGTIDATAKALPEGAHH